MKKITLLLLLTLSIIGVQAQTYQLNYDSIRVGKTAGTGGTSLYGKVYLKNVSAGLSTDSALVVRNGRIFKYPAIPALSFGTFGSTPNAQGGSYSAGVITLQPASASFPGGVTTGTQNFSGLKTFSNNGIVVNFDRSVAGGAVMGLQIAAVDKSFIEWNINDAGISVGTAMNLRNSQGAVGIYDSSNTGLKISGGNGTFAGTLTYPTPFTLGATSVTTTGTQFNYLNAATGTTGTTSTNLVFSTSPTLVTPTIGAAIFTTLTGGTASSVSWANTSAGNVTNSMSIRNGGTTTGTGNGVNFVTGTSLNSARINNVLTSATEGDLVFSTMTASTLAEAGRFLSDKTLSLAAGITGTTATFSGGLKWGASTFESGLAKLYTDATYGVNLVSKTGSSTDFLLLTPSGGQILSVPTGTTNVSIAGTVSASNLVSGTYTPTLTNGTNVSSSSVNGDFHYIRVGNQVTVEGSVTINFSAAGNTIFDISLPIASNFSSAYQLNGSGINNAPSIAGSAICRSDSTNDRMSMNFAALSTNGLEYVIHFTYTII